MDILFTKSKWEIPEVPFDQFLQRTQASGFDGIECSLDFENKTAKDILAAGDKYGLRYVGFIWADGSTVQRQIEDFDRQFQQTVKCAPLLINLHIGRDIFPFEDNLRIYQHVYSRAGAQGVRVVIETHRSRPTYSAIETRRYLEALPTMRLNADLSHWMVVHESDLSDQRENIEIALKRSDHIHARIGFEQGPQVTDPRAPQWEAQRSNHLKLWKTIVQHHRDSGSKWLTIMPEFGPYPYAQASPYTTEPVVDPWEINLHMKALLERELTGTD